MPPRAETDPGAREPRITAAERARLVSSVAEQMQSQQKQKPELVFSLNWQLVERYGELIAMVGLLKEDEALTPTHQAHLRKMIALETGLVSWPSYVKDFETAIKSEIQPELAAMKDFPEDLHGLPKAWDNAYTDLAKLMDRL